MSDRCNFLHARYPYRGHFTPGNLVFNANLQEFAQRIGYISALETNGKLTPEESYKQIQVLWQQLAASAENLGISA